jgi:hypothetical protein
MQLHRQKLRSANLERRLENCDTPAIREQGERRTTIHCEKLLLDTGWVRGAAQKAAPRGAKLARRNSARNSLRQKIAGDNERSSYEYSRSKT